MPAGERILLIDHDSNRAAMSAAILGYLGAEAVFESEFPAAIADDAFGLAIVAWSAECESPEARLAGLREAMPALPLLVVGSCGAGLVQSLGIIAVLEWPLRHEALLSALHRARIYREQYAQSRERGTEPKLFRALVGRSEGVRAVRRMMAQVAETDATVLVLGESGTGKEVVARSLHDYSHRRAGPFVPINCGAIPAELLESELFGHEKGAFTGAVTARAGRFELARGGTLFLDEIGDMPLTMQVKLLRVLQERRFERVGGSQTLDADVRIVCATHKNLDDMIASGGFREDLYYRINVFPIDLPPLRERADDLPVLVNELVLRLEKDGRGSVRFGPSALVSLGRHHWAGNVRELANLVERMAIMHPGAIVGARDLPAKFRHLEPGEDDTAGLPEPIAAAAASAVEPFAAASRAGGDLGLLPVNGLDLKEFIQDLEQGLIQQALDDCGGVVARAAERLRLRRTTLVEKMRKYGMLGRADTTEV